MKNFQKIIFWLVFLHFQEWEKQVNDQEELTIPSKTAPQNQETVVVTFVASK